MCLLGLINLTISNKTRLEREDKDNDGGGKFYSDIL
jgi:hypothetical protein